MTLRKALLRGLLGAPLGIFIGYSITILVSFIGLKDGAYSPVVPQLAQTMANEISAVIAQYILCAVLGFAFSIGSAIFEIEEWSITKQTVVHFLVITSAYLPTAYLCYWMQHTLWGILSFIIVFVVLYVIIWIVQMYFWKMRINNINRKIQGGSH